MLEQMWSLNRFLKLGKKNKYIKYIYYYFISNTFELSVIINSFIIYFIPISKIIPVCLFITFGMIFIRLYIQYRENKKNGIPLVFFDANVLPTFTKRRKTYIFIFILLTILLLFLITRLCLR